MITREWLLEQLKMYQEQKNNALNIANANQGAMEAIESTLKQFDLVEEIKPMLNENKSK